MKKPNLLLAEYSSIGDIADRVCSCTYFPLDEEMPTARYRGTVVEVNKMDGQITVIGWQRNTARLQKMDVSLPTIITITLRYDNVTATYRITAVELDSRFKGSKGILCSASYLDRMLRTSLTGASFDMHLLKKVRIETMHCFHLVEVLSGMICYFTTIQEELLTTKEKPLFYEEEVLDSLPTTTNTTDFSVCGCQIMKGKPELMYRMTFAKLLDLIRFSNDGKMSCTGMLDYSFALLQGESLSGTIPFEGSGFLHIGFQKMLLTCIRMIQSAFAVDTKNKFLCTNLYPAALIGLLTQAMAIRRFSNNYTYIMHALTAIQRQDEVPLCIGSARSPAEMRQFFPDFTQQDLKG